MIEAHTQRKSKLRCIIKKPSPSLWSLKITISPLYVQTFYQHACSIQQKKIDVPGFEHGKAPLSYIEQHFEISIMSHLKELFLQHFVIGYLYEQIIAKKLITVGDPRLTSIHISQNDGAQFTFELSVLPPPDPIQWENLHFKSPRRKKYKDLDRQVDHFISSELDRLKHYPQEGISERDWVNFSITILDETESKPLLPNYKQDLWLRIGTEEADKLFHSVFLGKCKGDTVCIQNKGLQAYFSEYIDANYTFCITILDHIPHHYFCFESFKYQFKLKTDKAIAEKLIEVFSLTNDLPQRRLMAEATMKLLVTKHHITIPHHLILREEQAILTKLSSSPDYDVYRLQKNFKQKVEQLAIKKLKEKVVLDHIAHQHSINVNHHDIRSYLNLSNRDRTKNFVYFDFIETKLNEQEVPISTQELAHFCLREKTLNYIIFQLTQ
ncbi:MAG: trigger factor family protein [Candidatus Babeliales bacterium]